MGKKADLCKEKRAQIKVLHEQGLSQRQISSTNLSILCATFPKEDGGFGQLQLS
jgi:IS30 family transposase